jgi:uncharacterized protein YcbK (DUF882 family)
MTENIFQYLKYFTRDEAWGDPDKMDHLLLYTLDDLREYVKKPIHVHCGFESRGTGGFHPLGLAVDLHIENASLWEQFEAAIRFPFRGIGVYPRWNSPGLHLDMRPLPSGSPRALWACVKPGVYVDVTPSIF